MDLFGGENHSLEAVLKKKVPEFTDWYGFDSHYFGIDAKDVYGSLPAFMKWGKTQVFAGGRSLRENLKREQ